MASLLQRMQHNDEHMQHSARNLAVEGVLRLHPSIVSMSFLSSLCYRNTVQLQRILQGLSKTQPAVCYRVRQYSDEKSKQKKPQGQEDVTKDEEDVVTDPHLPPWPGGVNPHTGERGGPRGPEPTRYGDWERKGRVSDF